MEKKRELMRWADFDEAIDDICRYPYHASERHGGVVQPRSGDPAQD
jgi:hypothetical protein